MKENKRSLEALLSLSAVGITMSLGTAQLVQTMHEFGCEYGSKLQEYIGTVGSAALEYGFPGGYTIAMGAFIYGTLKILDNHARQSQLELQ